MEALISHFTYLSDEACQNKSFEPSAIEDLMRLFELEAYKAWAALELEEEKEVEEAESDLKEAEEELESAMESAMEEMRRFEEEMEMMSKKEMGELVDTAEKARRMGKLMEKAASVASKKYMEAALGSATASMRSAWKAISSNRVHPS